MTEVQSIKDYVLPFARKNGITLAIHLHVTHTYGTTNTHMNSISIPNTAIRNAKDNSL